MSAPGPAAFERYARRDARHRALQASMFPPSHEAQQKRLELERQIKALQPDFIGVKVTATTKWGKA